MKHEMKHWLPAFAGMTCLACGAGLVSIFGFFVGPLSAEFDVGVATLNMAPVALLLVPGLVAPFIGRLADRVPIRRLLLTGCTVSMFSLFLVSRAPSLHLAGLAFLCFAIGLTMYGPVVVNGLMVKLYPGREARALAIAAIGISVSSAALPPLVGFLLGHLDWRTTLAALALGIVCLLWLVVLSVVPASAGGALQAREEVDRSVYRRKEFWLIGGCVALAFNVAIVQTIAYPPHFVSRGFTLAQAGMFIAVGGLAGFTGKAFVAWLGDAGRHYAKWLAAALLILQVAGFAVLLQAYTVPIVVCAMLLLGFGGGAFLPMHPYLNSRYFDASIIAQVNGAQMPLFLPLGLAGPPLAGYVFDSTGNYDLVFGVLAGVLLVSALVSLALPAGREASLQAGSGE